MGFFMQNIFILLVSVTCLILLITVSLLIECNSFSSCNRNEIAFTEVPECLILKEESCPQSIKLKNNCDADIVVYSYSQPVAIANNSAYFFGYDVIQLMSGSPSYQLTLQDITGGWLSWKNAFDITGPAPFHWAWEIQAGDKKMYVRGIEHPGKNALNCYYLKKLIYIERIVVIVLIAVGILYALIRGGLGSGTSYNSEF